MMMINEVIKGKTLSGKTKYTVTVKTSIGKTTYVRTDWEEIIKILGQHRDPSDTHTRWYGEGRYMGD